MTLALDATALLLGFATAATGVALVFVLRWAARRGR